jgi:Ser/Thr protein kinase RdoA (MazF antagonist)
VGIYLILTGSLDRRNLLDYVFTTFPGAGPFTSIKLFHDWFAGLLQRRLSESQKFKDPYRECLPDTGAITLTHGDLHRENIIISSTSPPSVVAIIDWAHAGWYPDYWEYCKALYTSSYEDEWRIQWIPKFLSPYEDECETFDYYTMGIGAV